jgi:hypothetical protein
MPSGVLESSMSENGPREGTKDLPRRDPESGHRTVEPGSPSGRAYRLHARQERERLDSIRELGALGLAAEEIAARYEQDHPLERELTAGEVRAILDAPSPSPKHRSADSP